MNTQINFSSSVKKLKKLQKGISSNSFRYFGKNIVNTIEGFPVLNPIREQNNNKENSSFIINCNINAETKPKIDNSRKEIHSIGKYPFPSILQCDIPIKQNPQYLYEYSIDIFTELLSTMNVNKPVPLSFTKNQKEISYKFRNILVDWIVEVHSHFKLQEETLFLCVNLLDRVFERTSVKKSELQLIGVTCLFIASKVEYIYPPELCDFAYITKKACTVKNILNKEREILKLLDFDILTVYVYTLFQRIHFISKSPEKAFNLGLFILEVMFYDEGFLNFNDYIKALSALFIAVEMGCKGYHLPKYLLEVYRTNKPEIKKCIILVMKVMKNLKAMNLNAVIEKTKKKDSLSELCETKDDKIIDEKL